MSSEVILIGIAAFLQGLVVLYIETRLKKSIDHKFDVRLEEVKQSFLREMAERDRHDRFRLAGLDERMKAHQKAFELARKMGSKVHADDRDKMVILNECEQFWDASSLYLTDDARQSFRMAQHYFASYSTYLQVRRLDPKSEESKKDLELAFNTIQGLPLKIIGIIDRESSGKQDPVKDESITILEKKKKVPRKS